MPRPTPPEPIATGSIDDQISIMMFRRPGGYIHELHILHKQTQRSITTTFEIYGHSRDIVERIFTPFMYKLEEKLHASR